MHYTVVPSPHPREGDKMMVNFRFIHVEQRYFLIEKTSSIQL